MAMMEVVVAVVSVGSVIGSSDMVMVVSMSGIGVSIGDASSKAGVILASESIVLGVLGCSVGMLSNILHLGGGRGGSFSRKSGIDLIV